MVVDDLHVGRTSRLPHLRCGVEGAFPRGSVQHHRPVNPQTLAGQTCLCRARHGRQERLLPPQGLFAEKQPPPACACCLTHADRRRLSGLPAARCAAQAGALLFRPFSWACKKKASPKAWEGRGGVAGVGLGRRQQSLQAPPTASAVACRLGFCDSPSRGE